MQLNWYLSMLKCIISVNSFITTPANTIATRFLPACFFIFTHLPSDMICSFEYLNFSFDNVSFLLIFISIFAIYSLLKLFFSIYSVFCIDIQTNASYYFLIGAATPKYFERRHLL